MIDKIREWYASMDAEFSFAYAATTVIAIIYTVIWSLNWVFTKFLDFTGLWFIVLAWVAWSLGNTVAMFLERKDVEEEEEDDEHQFL